MAPTLLTTRELVVLERTEKIASCFSLLGASFIILTFVLSPDFRKPVNRLIFYASWGNMLGNAATLISQSGIRAGQRSALCQFQAFLIQMFFIADALWNLAMAVNVYLTLFKKYSAEQLKALEWRYHVMCYGVPFVIALAYCFIDTRDNGRIYGPAQLWCWISNDWAFLRLVTFYVPAWICIAVSFTLYIMAGREIFRKRAELRAFREPSRTSVEEPFSGLKTTEVSVRHELAGFNFLDPPPASYLDTARLNHSTGTAPKGYEQYSTNIHSSPPSTAFDPSPRTSSHSTPAHKRCQESLEANTAAWRYTKVALLFFVSLCITWGPSSINRIYDLAHPTAVSYQLNIVSAIVLPLMGFWNGVIYFVTTRAVSKAIFWDLVERVAPRKKSAHPPTLGARSLRNSTEARKSKGAGVSARESLTSFAKEGRAGDEQV
ncbi:MAG: hypothetical protein Q9177_001058 [Variospora cf. flavescens]